MLAAAPWISFLMTKQQMNKYFDQVREIRYSHLILQFSSFYFKDPRATWIELRSKRKSSPRLSRLLVGITLRVCFIKLTNQSAGLIHHAQHVHL